MPHAITSIGITILLVAVSTFAQSSPGELYQRARLLDESNQNPTEAIRLYSQFISVAKDDRARAAKAQYRIGVLYNRIGKTREAQRAFKSVVTQYPDQPEIVRHARPKIVADPNRQSENRIEIDREGPSPDGRFLATFTFPPYAALSRPVIDEQRHRLYIIVKPTTPSRETKKLPPGARRLGSIVYWPSTLVAIDTRKLAIVKIVPLPVHTTEVALSTVNDKLYTSEFIDGHVRVIDPITFATVARIPAPGYPMDPIFNPATKKIYVASQGFPGDDPLSIIDPLTNSITRTVGTGGAVGNIIINPATNRVYIPRDENTRVLNGEDGSLIADLPEMLVVSADPINNRIYAQGASGPERPTLSVLDGNTHDILAALAYKDASYKGGISINSRVNRLYIALPEINQIVVLDAITHREINRIAIRVAYALTADSETGNVYVCYSPTPITHVLGVMRKEALEEAEAPEEFFDDFDGPELDSEWIAPGGKNSYSLIQNPGFLRYRVSGPTDTRLILARKFRGEEWMFETKISFFSGTTGGGRTAYFTISLDALNALSEPFAYTNGIYLSRYRGDWNGKSPGEISFFFAEKGAMFSYIRERPWPTDTYFYRIKRNHRTVTVERSSDGNNFTLLASRTFDSQIDDQFQCLMFGYNAHGASDGYVDIDYVRLTRLSPQGRR
ncbi:MAG TPA: tetratricopeptide repeat protein [Blastocatellia bacterium]|jgi:DNA-binding beta-propeller fold protein YncE